MKADLHCHTTISDGFMKEMQQHIEKNHGFAVDVGRTVIYGLCSDCQRAIESEEQKNKENK